MGISIASSFFWRNGGPQFIVRGKRLIPHRLIYGYYPDVVNNPGSESEIVKQLADSYLYKDILVWDRIQKPDKMEKLAQALAFQVGQLVSYNELGQMCGLNNETVEKYIGFLEKAFIIFVYLDLAVTRETN